MDSDVQFEEEDILSIKRPIPVAKKKMGLSFGAIAISLGLAKDEKEAQIVMLIAVGVLVLGAVAFYVIGTHPTNVPKATTQEMKASFQPNGNTDI